MTIDFLDETSAENSNIELETGYGGVLVKDLVKNDGDSVTFVFPLGLDPESYDADDSYNGSELVSSKTCTFWMNTSQLNDAAKETFNIEGKDRAFTRTFHAASKPTGQEWYLDLGYSHDNKHEKQQLSEGVITEESYKDARGAKYWYAGNSVMPTLWYNVPIVLVEVDGKGKDRTFNFTKAVWLKLKGTRGQFGAFMDAFKGLEEGDDPSVHNRVIKLTRTGETGNYYEFTRMDYLLPDEYDELVVKEGKRVHETYMTLFKNIHANQHAGITPSGDPDPKKRTQDKASNDAVRAYLVGISTSEDWAEFVEEHNIFANPIDVSELESISVLSLEDD